MIDFSDYPLNSKFFDPVNKKVIGKIKDEFKGRIISEFVGLKSNMHSLIRADDEEVAKAKRVNKKIKHKEFVDALLYKKVIKHKVKKIQINCTELELMISCFDDKRYVLDNGVITLAYFHKDIKY